MKTLILQMLQRINPSAFNNSSQNQQLVLQPAYKAGLGYFKTLAVILVSMSSFQFAMAQTTQTATWALTANGNAVVSNASLTGTALAIGSGITSPVYNGTTGVSTSSWANDSSLLEI